jgi:hypothetical protein
LIGRYFKWFDLYARSFRSVGDNEQQRASFVYLDLNSLNKPSNTADVAARGLVRRPLYNFRSYKSCLPIDMQQALAKAELTKLRARRNNVDVSSRLCDDVDDGQCRWQTERKSMPSRLPQHQGRPLLSSTITATTISISAHSASVLNTFGSLIRVAC